VGVRVAKERSGVGEIEDGEGAVTKDAPEDETRLCLSNPEDFKLGSQVVVRIEAIDPVPAPVKIESTSSRGATRRALR
jgi:hypothetical protein